MLHRGRWDGRQLIDAKLVDKMTAYSGMPIRDRKKQGAFEPASGLAWWTNHDGVWPAVPRDAYAGAGAGHQVVLVVPSLDLIVVRNGDPMKDGTPNSGFFGPIYRYLFEPLMRGPSHRRARSRGRRSIATTCRLRGAATIIGTQHMEMDLDLSRTRS